jgi:hypothetical protein
MFGYSFDPNRKDNTQGNLPTGQALQVVSTHLPKVLGRGAVSSPELLAQSNRGPSAESILMQSLLRAKMASGTLGGAPTGADNPAMSMVRQIAEALGQGDGRADARLPHVINAMPPSQAPALPTAPESPMAPEPPNMMPARMTGGPAFGGVRRGWS